MVLTLLLLLGEVKKSRRCGSMKKTGFIVSGILIAVILAAHIGLFNALFMLLLMGVIPGTEIVIPANVMLLIISTVTCAVIFYPAVKTILHAVMERTSIGRNGATGSHLPKQRFTKIEA
jgi:hypothetical protein